MNTAQTIIHLDRLSEEKRLSEFARAAGVDRRTIQRFVGGTTSPHPSILKLISIELARSKWKDKK